MARRDLTAMVAAAALAATSLPAVGAEGWQQQLSRTLELPAHEWLAGVRADPATRLAPFTTDGCSGGMSSFWSFVAERFPAFAEAHNGTPPWESCCVTHDRAYHDAGPDPSPEASYAARLAADETLRDCIAQTADSRDAVLSEIYGLDSDQIRQVYSGIAAGMFQAVRLGGGPCTGLPWRWGYGYPQCWKVLRK